MNHTSFECPCEGEERETLNWWCCSITRLKNGTLRWMATKAFASSWQFPSASRERKGSSSSFSFFFILVGEEEERRETTLRRDTFNFCRRRSLQQQQQQQRRRQCLQSLITDWGNDRDWTLFAKSLTLGCFGLSANIVSCKLRNWTLKSRPPVFERIILPFSLLRRDRSFPFIIGEPSLSLSLSLYLPHNMSQIIQSSSIHCCYSSSSSCSQPDCHHHHHLLLIGPSCCRQSSRDELLANVHLVSSTTTTKKGTTCNHVPTKWNLVGSVQWKEIRESLEEL